MESSTLFPLIIGLLAVVLAVWVFINAVITKKWRNLAPGEEQGWKWGVFYYNPHDQRLILPKRSGLGYTLNFAKPAAIFILVLLIGTILYLAFLNKTP